MTRSLVLVSVTEPTEAELQAAILAFGEKAERRDGEETFKAGLTIIGAACALLEQGATTQEAISSLAGRGLLEDCAKPLVEKANEVVQSNKVVNSTNHPPLEKSRSLLVSFAIATVIAIGLFVYLRMG